MLLLLSRYCFYSVFLFLPFQVKVFFGRAELYDSGFFNPFVNHFLFLSEIFLILALVFFALHLCLAKEKSVLSLKKDKLLWLIIVFVFSILLSMFFSVDIVNSFVYLLRFFEVLLVYGLFATGLFDFRKVMLIFVGVMAFEGVIAIMQYSFQHSLGLHFLGEPVLNPMMKGIATVDVGDKVLRAYGTFPHPNVLAIYLVFALYFALNFLSGGKQRWLLYLLIAVFLTGLIVTFSRAALLAALAGFVVYLIRGGRRWKYVVTGLLFFLVAVFVFKDVFVQRFWLSGDSAVLERWLQLGVAWKMFLSNPFGVGMGNFTLLMQDYSVLKLLPWNFQPVHNTFILAFVELGFFGGLALLAIFFEIFRKLFRKKLGRILSLAVIVVIAAMFDHYFLTLYQGQMLLALFFVSFSYAH